MYNDKKNMIDFINKYFRLEGKRIPKKVLKQLSKEQLLELINSSDDTKSLYNTYIENIILTKQEDSLKNKQSTHKSNNNENKEYLVNELIQLVDQLKKDPTDFLNIHNLHKFINNLPYGTIDRDVLKKLINDVMNDDLKTAFTLLKYSADQEVYFQNNKE